MKSQREAILVVTATFRRRVIFRLQADFHKVDWEIRAIALWDGIKVTIILSYQRERANNQRVVSPSSATQNDHDEPTVAQKPRFSCLLPWFLAAKSHIGARRYVKHTY